MTNQRETMLIKTGAKIKFLEVLKPDAVEAFFKKNSSAFNRLASVHAGVAIDPSKFLYMRVRMVSAVEAHGPNANGDAFEHRELASRYATFIDAPVNIDHDNDSLIKAVGFILDARYLPEPEAMYVEGVHAIDRAAIEERRPGLLAAIESGSIKDSSMGCFVEKSLCSQCLAEAGWDGDFGNLDHYAAKLSIGHGIATVPEEYCHHIGRYGERKCASGPYEINRGVTFFEDSIITTAGADPDAKYLERLAGAGQDWRKFLIQRKPEGGSEMKPLGNVKKAEELRLDTKQEKPDYGSGSEKDNALADQAKGSSGTTPEHGNRNDTMDEKGDYALGGQQALAALAIVKRMAAEDPETVKSLIFEDPSMGGKPAAVKDGEKDQDTPKAIPTDAPKAAPTQAPEVAPAVAPKAEAPEKKEEKKEAPKAASLLHQAMELLKKAISGSGNPTETAVEKDMELDPKTGQPDKALADQAKGSSGDTPMHGDPTQTAKDAKDYPHGAAVLDRLKKLKAARANRRATAGDQEAARLDHMITEMQQGRSYAEALKNVDEKFGVTARVAARRSMAEDLARGSMGSPGRNDTLTFSAEDEGKDGKPFPPKDEKEKTFPPKAEGGRRKAEEKDDKAEKDDKKPAFLEKEEGLGCAGSRRKAMDRPNETEDERIQEGTEEIKDNVPFRADASRRKAIDEVAPEAKPEGVTTELDNKSEAIEAMVKAKRARASMLAQAGFIQGARRNLVEAKELKAAAAEFTRMADEISVLAGSQKVEADVYSQKAIKDRIKAVVAIAVAKLAEVDKKVEDVSEKDEEDDEKVEAAKRQASLKARLATSEREKAQKDSALKAELKAKAVKTLIDLGVKKGIVNTANLQVKIAELSKASDEVFMATKQVWASLPDSLGARGDMPKSIREASRTSGNGMTLSSATKQVSTGSLEEGTLFE